MPSEILSRIPLPSLRVYTTISVLLVAGCVYYAFNVTNEPSWRQNVNITLQYPPAATAALEDGSVAIVVPEQASVEEHVNVKSSGNENVLDSSYDIDGEFRTVWDQLQDIISFMGQEAICIWVSGRICISMPPVGETHVRFALKVFLDRSRRARDRRPV